MKSEMGDPERRSGETKILAELGEGFTGSV